MCFEECTLLQRSAIVLLCLQQHAYTPTPLLWQLSHTVARTVAQTIAQPLHNRWTNRWTHTGSRPQRGAPPWVL
jgi:hypothetical protein